MEADGVVGPALLDPAGSAAWHFGGAKLFDKRRTDRLVRAARRILGHPGGTMPQKFGDRADLAGLYRLAACERVTHGRVLEVHRGRTREAMAAHEGVVLVVHDTTELDFTAQSALHEQLGPIGNGSRRGLLCHNSLAVGLGPGGERRVLGLAAQVLHKRREVPEGETPSAKRRHPGRESRLWLAGCEQVGPPPAGSLWVDVCDRGSDTFEFLCHELGRGRHFVVRCAKDRNLHGEDHVGGDRVHRKLYAYVRDLPPLGRRQVAVAAAAGRPARTARVHVAGGPVVLAAPERARGEYRPEPLEVWAVHVREVEAPAGVPPLEWVLLSDLPADTFARASERVDWYEQRPVVEDYHKGQKSGLAIQLPRFTEAAHLGPVVALLSVTAAVLLGVRDAGRQRDAELTPATRLAPPVYVRVLAAHTARRAREHGPRARPPATPDMSVRQFVTELAMLGGFQARKSDGPPGWQTLWRGWEKLQLMVDGVTAIYGETCVYE